MKSIFGLFVMLFTALFMVFSAIGKRAFAFFLAFVGVMLFVSMAHAVSNQVRLAAGVPVGGISISNEVLITSNVAGVTVNTPAVAKGIVRRIQNLSAYGVSMKRGDSVCVSTMGVHIAPGETVVDHDYFGICYFTSGRGATYDNPTSSACAVGIETITW